MRILKLSEVESLPEPFELTPEELKQAYRLARASITEEEIREYETVREWIPFEDLVRELEEQQQIADGSKP